MTRAVHLTPANAVADDVPVWVWEHGGKGRIQLGTLSLFAGRPGAGKSSAARWLAAQYSNGTLPGCWHGKPQNVAYIAPAEESTRYVVKPGLRAAGADLERICFLEVTHDERQVRLQTGDVSDLSDLLQARQVTVVIVDPLMSTIGANVDIHRNNEVREHLDPWATMAADIGGVVHGVVHLVKAPGGDVVAGINGSSAFGEVARSVFAFAKDAESDQDRIMSQEKNSAGEEDLALVYRIESRNVRTDSGQSAEVGRFVITGESRRTVADALQDNASGSSSEVADWLADFLTGNRVRSRDAKDAGKAEGFSASSIDRAARKLNVVKQAEGFPRVTWWSLPDDQSQSHHQSRQSPKAGATDATERSHTTVTPATSVTPPLGTTDATEESTDSPDPEQSSISRPERGCHNRRCPG
ncbi:AAA family ATPase [Mycolicibacterium sp.]|uniref:AAA family ATPase n=1 Tax=Mycolicibacterium sp. TaxID=2320850 RepID=UPI003D12F597